MPPHRPPLISDIVEDETTLRCTVSGSSADANAIRRSLLTNIPCLAFDVVNFIKNTTSIPDEIIAHRMSMFVITCPPYGLTQLTEIPFDDKRTDPSSRNAGNTLFYNLRVCGRAATTADLIPMHSQTWQDDFSTFLIPGIIVGMNGEQELHITAEATVGYGRQHTRWNCAVAPSIRPVVHIQRKPFAQLADIENLAATCHRGVFSNTGKILDNGDACNYCGECADVMDVMPSKDTFLLKFESTGAISKRQMLQVAIQALAFESSKLMRALTSARS